MRLRRARFTRPTSPAFGHALWLTLPLAVAACSGSPDPTPQVPAPCPTAKPEASGSANAPGPSVPAPASVARAEGRVTTLASRDDVPLTGPRVDGKAGDRMIDDGVSAVVVTQEGRIADFGKKGSRDELVWLNPTIAYGLSNLDTPVKRVAAEPGDKAIRVEREVAGKPALLVSWVYLVKGQLHVDTVALGTGDDPALAMTLGERFSWGNFPTFMDRHGWITDAAKIGGRFLARDGLGTAYAVCSESGPFFAKFDEQEFGGFFEPARTGESVILVPAHGASDVRSIVMTASAASMGEAVMALPCGPRGAGPTRTLPLHLKELDDVPRVRLEIAACDEKGGTGKPFLEYHVRPEAAEDDPSAADLKSIELPEGCFRARYRAPGHTAGKWFDPAELGKPLSADRVPVAGKIAFRVTERGAPSPFRAVVRGEGNTPDPDWGDNAGRGGAATNVVAAEHRKVVWVPPGKYRVTVTRGFELTAVEQKIEVKAGKILEVNADLERVVDTKGWITADMHLHAVPSSDAPSLLPDRIMSLVGSGIEVAIATDHNAVTDYGPTIAAMKLDPWIAGLVGDEITTRDAPFGHFNAFPLDPSTPPFAYKDTTPQAIFSAVHAAKPLGKDTILQVNHPRMGGIGYFELLRFDPTDIPAWLGRSPLADMSFDAMEVFNGDHYTKISKVEEVMKDWFALLNAGYRPTATGNSDSHRVSFHEPGVPRNLVMVPDDDPRKLDLRTFTDAVRKGRVVVSSGPFVTLKIGDKTIGDTVPAGEVEIEAIVDAPPWVDVSEVSLVKRGEGLSGWKLDKKSGKPPWRFKTKTTLKKGDWVIAIARGSKPMTYLYRSGATPFGFTNPIFVN